MAGRFSWRGLLAVKRSNPHLRRRQQFYSIQCSFISQRGEFSRALKSDKDQRAVRSSSKLVRAQKCRLMSTTAKKSRYWQEWTTEDFSTADLSQAVAVLPIGAVEAHGPHLPLGTDAMHNEALLEKALEKLPDDCTVLALPAFQVGVSCEHSAFAGTLQLSAETALKAWFEVASCVKTAGVNKLVVYNSHGGNHPLAEVLARRVRHDLNMLCLLAMNLGDVPACICSLFPEDEAKFGIHGGALETSLMLAIKPDLVHMEKAKNFHSTASRYPESNSKIRIHQPGFANKIGWLAQDLNPNGVAGDATLSTTEKGHALADAAATAFADILFHVYELNVKDVLAADTSALYRPQGPPIIPPKGRLPLK